VLLDLYNVHCCLRKNRLNYIREGNCLLNCIFETLPNLNVLQRFVKVKESDPIATGLRGVLVGIERIKRVLIQGLARGKLLVEG